jgi:hypothetical protein
MLDREVGRVYLPSADIRLSSISTPAAAGGDFFVILLLDNGFG